MKKAAKVKRRASVFIFKAEYGYEVSPSPVVVPRRGATLDFKNLSYVEAKVSIPGTRPFTLGPGKKHSVSLPICTSAKDRVILYEVAMGGGLLALGNSAPTIIRDP